MFSHHNRLRRDVQGLTGFAVIRITGFVVLNLSVRLHRDLPSLFLLLCFVKMLLRFNKPDLIQIQCKGLTNIIPIIISGFFSHPQTSSEAIPQNFFGSVPAVLNGNAIALSV